MSLRAACDPSDSSNVNSSSELNEMTAELLLNLHPLSAAASQTPTAKNLISLGLPIAYLTRIDLRIKWANFSVLANFKRSKTGVENAEEKDYSQGASGKPIGVDHDHGNYLAEHEVGAAGVIDLYKVMPVEPRGELDHVLPSAEHWTPTRGAYTTAYWYD